MLNVAELTHDAAKVVDTIIEVGDTAITKTGCKIYIPSRYVEKGMASIGEEIRIACVFAIVVDDKFYAVSNTTAPMRITPTYTTLVKTDETEYYEFVFDAGAQITPNVNLVKTSSLAYDIYDVIMSRVYVPWYLDYFDLGSLMDTADAYGGIKLFANSVPVEIIASVVSRDPADVTKHYRETIKSLDDVKKRPPTYTPLSSVLHGATNATAMLLGNHFDEGLNTALIKHTDRIDTVETLLRI